MNAVKKQAAELRFIMEAPKLQLKPEERITLPLLDNLGRHKYVFPNACLSCTGMMLVAKYAEGEYTYVIAKMQSAYRQVFLPHSG